ncbi:MAG: heptaprenyl diphosphate synthase, partial [Treponema sp. GWB1_62_6]
MTEFWKAVGGLEAELALVSERIRVASRSDSRIIDESLSSLLDADGKMLRPGLLLVASRFGNGAQDKIIALAASIEMLHVATLVHDDVIDDSPFRRGLPAVHARFGKKDAVLVGDYLLSRCFLLASSYTSPENASRLARAVSVMCVMEIEQDMDRYTANPSIRRYLRKILGKTAVLFSLACHTGATEAKAPAPIAARLRRIGYDIGMAFQIIDDILDYEGAEDEVRKPVGNDLKAGLATLPLICALRNDDGALQALVAPGSFPGADPSAIIAAVVARGGIQGARVWAARYTERALAGIARLPAG